MDDSKLPTDHFSQELRRWHDMPQATVLKPVIVQTLTFLGHSETWTVQTARHPELGESVFIQRISPDGQLQLVLPAKVAECLARQRDSISARNRRQGARRAVATKRAAGLPVGNPEALKQARRARKARSRKGRP